MGVNTIGSELTRLGHTQEIVCLDAPDETFVINHQRKVYALGSSQNGYRYSPALVPWLRTHARNYDAVIVDGLWQHHSFGTWRALAGSGIPYFVFTHGMLDPWFKRTYPLKHLKKWLYWPWAEYRVLRDATAVLFTCEEERLLARESFWLYRCNEAVTAFGTSSPPIDASRLKADFLSKHPQLEGKRLLLFLGRIHKKKGCDLLIEAFTQVARKCPDLHLIIAGPDQTGWMAELKQQASRHGIDDRITWPGMLEGDEKWGAYYASELFCLPSHQENFGIVVAEALACGKPVMISNKVNIWREIESDHAGIVHDDTVEATTQALQQWLDFMPETRLAMSQAARYCFDSRFRIDRVAESLVSIIQNSVPPLSTPTHPAIDRGA